MPDDTAKTSPQSKSLESGWSDDFVLPEGPPPPPPKTARHPPPPESPFDTSSETASNTGNSPPTSSKPSLVPDNDEEKAPLTLKFHDPLEPPNSNPELEDSHDAPVSKTSEQSSSDSLVVGLVCIILVLFFVNVLQFVNTPNNNPKPNEDLLKSNRELATARQEADVCRQSMAQMQDKISNLEKRPLASQTKMAEDRVASLLKDNKIIERQNTELIAETARLKTQLQNASRPAAVPIPNPVTQRPPATQQNGQTYRVAGLRPGDTLNARSGPGVNYPSIIELQNGVRVKATGEAVMNDSDAWMPCLVVTIKIDPATGYEQLVRLKCWINSFFIERCEN